MRLKPGVLEEFGLGARVEREHRLERVRVAHSVEAARREAGRANDRDRVRRVCVRVQHRRRGHEQLRAAAADRDRDLDLDRDRD